MFIRVFHTESCNCTHAESDAGLLGCLDVMNSVSAGHGALAQRRAGTEGSWQSRHRKSPVLIQLWHIWTFGSGAAKRAFKSISLSCKLQPCIFNFLRIIQCYSAASKPNTSTVQMNRLSWLSLRRLKQIRLSSQRIQIQCLKNYANNAEMISNSFLNKSRTVIL